MLPPHHPSEAQPRSASSWPGVEYGGNGEGAGIFGCRGCGVFQKGEAGPLLVPLQWHLLFESAAAVIIVGRWQEIVMSWQSAVCLVRTWLPQILSSHSCHKSDMKSAGIQLVFDPHAQHGPMWGVAMLGAEGSIYR